MKSDLSITEDVDTGRAKVPMNPTLVLLYLGGTLLVKPWRVTPVLGSLKIGRAVEADDGIRLEDQRTSRLHAVIQCDLCGQLSIVDASSRNGTAVNGLRVQQSPLRDGDVVRVGDSLFIVRYEPERCSDSPCSYLVGESMVAVQLRKKLARVAAERGSVLLLGETGTGKEVAARYLHEGSGRTGPLVTVNSSALPETLVESLLFGHTRGAFTGAVPQQGFFRAAHQGTLFFDEVGDMPLTIQPKLLRVLEEHIIFPLGAVSGHPADARLLFATNMDLPAAVAAGRFRGDLYARISQVVVELPPLRARTEDVFLLLQYALPKGPRLKVPASLAEALLLHHWPNNVREVVKLAAEISATGDIDAITARLRRPVAASIPTRPPAVDVDIEGSVPDREQLDKMLRFRRGNVAAVARKLQVPRTYVYRWAEEYSIDLNDYR